MVKFARSTSAAQGSPVWILGVDLALLIRPCCGGVPHRELEGPTARIYNYVLGLWGEKKKKTKKEEDWQQMSAQGQSSSP